jgi:hypothetical protein
VLNQQVIRVLSFDGVTKRFGSLTALDRFGRASIKIIFGANAWAVRAGIRRGPLWWR